MVIRVAERTAAALGTENTYIATEDQRIVDVCTQYGYQAVLTSDNCKTGTDRLYEASLQIEADIYINVQGDEPLVDPQDIKNIAQAKVNQPEYVINGMRALEETEEPTDINIPKVITNRFNELVYMSRLAIPGIKDVNIGKPVYKKQVCIYAFSKTNLKDFSSFSSKAYNEQFEDIEILRFFDTYTKILMVDTEGQSLAVDIPGDVAKVENFMAANQIT
ncbi:3-deoxy-manno-octulosonate cytidylyltransferase [Mucilaginibacter koreensis]